MEGEDAEKLLVPSSKGTKAPELPQEWTAHVDFIEKWRAMKPVFDDASKLRPAVFLSRDVMAPARSRSELSESARIAVEALLKVDSVNSPVGQKIIETFSATDRRAAMSQLIEAMRPADWSGMVPGIHGAVILAKTSPDARSDLKAFLAGLQTGQMAKGMLYLLKQAGLIAGKG